MTDQTKNSNTLPVPVDKIGKPLITRSIVTAENRQKVLAFMMDLVEGTTEVVLGFSNRGGGIITGKPRISDRIKAGQIILNEYERTPEGGLVKKGDDSTARTVATVLETMSRLATVSERETRAIPEGHAEVI